MPVLRLSELGFRWEVTSIHFREASLRPITVSRLRCPTVFHKSAEMLAAHLRVPMATLVKHHLAYRKSDWK